MNKGCKLKKEEKYHDFTVRFSNFAPGNIKPYMLTIFQLQHLPLNEQAQYVWDNGEFLASKMEKEFTNNLYKIGQILAKVIYDDQTNTIVKVLFTEESVNDYL